MGHWAVRDPPTRAGLLEIHVAGSGREALGIPGLVPWPRCLRGQGRGDRGEMRVSVEGEGVFRTDSPGKIARVVPKLRNGATVRRVLVVIGIGCQTWQASLRALLSASC